MGLGTRLSLTLLGVISRDFTGIVVSLVPMADLVTLPLSTFSACHGCNTHIKVSVVLLGKTAVNILNQKSRVHAVNVSNLQSKVFPHMLYIFRYNFTILVMLHFFEQIIFPIYSIVMISNKYLDHGMFRGLT